MNDHLWMYRDSPKGCMRLIIVMGFIINYVLSNLRNISGGGIRCLCKKCKNKKKKIDPDVITMHLLQKRFMKRYLCLYAHGKPCVPHNTMVEKDD